MTLKAAQLSPLTLTQGSCQTQECVNQQSKWTQPEIWRKAATACLFVYSRHTHTHTHQQSAGDWTKQQQITAVAGMYLISLDSFMSLSTMFWYMLYVNMTYVLVVHVHSFPLLLLKMNRINNCVVRYLLMYNENWQCEDFLLLAIKLWRFWQWIRSGLAHEQVCEKDFLPAGPTMQ